MKRTRMKRKNPERAAKALAEDFGPQAELCRLMGCLVCGMSPSDPDHHPTRGAGGKDRNTAPLCRRHHDERGARGVVTFQRRYLVDLTLATLILRAVVQRRLRVREALSPGVPLWTPGIVSDCNDAMALIRGGGEV